MKTVTINRQWLRLEEIEEILASGAQLQLDDETKKEIQKCRDFLDSKVGNSSELIYGVNTGFGSLCNTAISSEDLSTLQSNLVRSHACGMGELVPLEIVKRMLLLKIMGLSHGKSGVQVATVERLIYFYNNDILPVVYQQGSLGASGDLAPLAHLHYPF
jgi:histidine ammonia-lyase